MKRFTLTPTNRHGMPGKTYNILIDDEDAHFLRSYAWMVGLRGGYVYRYGGADCHTLLLLHREIMRPHRDETRLYFANGNHFDVRRENLTLREPVDNALFRGFMRRVNAASNFSPALAS